MTDALIDFTDVFPTLLELADLEYPPDDHAIQGKSFAGVINGKRMDGNKKWTMSMGSHPALINTRGRIQSFFEFRDRAFRNDRYKIYVDTVRQIQRIYDLSSDPFETNNLLSDTSPNIADVRNEFEEYLSTVSKKDQSPKYKRARNSLWDIPPGKLAQKSERVNRRKNMLGPLISEEKYMEINY